MKIIKLFIISIILVVFVRDAHAKTTWWELQSVDTVKYSRDLAREMLENSEFDRVIDRQVADIANTGATHVAIGTPYDEEFTPFLKRWVATARKHGLKVWFRSNWSGWEGWFGYNTILREGHILKTEKFIRENKDLFEDGDIFTPCTECENGGPGDPRRSGDVEGHRAFLIEEYQTTKDAFRKIGRNVSSNYIPMNGDVAMLIMDEKTTRALGGVVVIDHYVATAAQLASDIEEIADSSGGKVVLGEFGAPIPSIHGAMTDEKQRDWIISVFEKLSNSEDLIGVNYWVNVGGETQLWDYEGNARPSADVLKFYFSPKALSGKAVNELGSPISDAKVTAGIKTVYTDSNGLFEMPYFSKDGSITINSSDYKVGEYDLRESIDSTANDNKQFTLIKKDPGLLFRIAIFFKNLLN